MLISAPGASGWWTIREGSSCQVIPIGSFAILLKWLLLGLVILIGVIIIKFRLMKLQNSEMNKKVFDLLSNSLFLGFIIWKVCLLLLEPSIIIKISAF